MLIRVKAADEDLKGTRGAWKQVSPEELTHSIVFHLADRIAQPPERVHWIAVLCGKMILDLKCLKNENGILLHYNAACMKPLQIHVTSDFKSQHSSIVAILSKARLSMGKQWHFSKAQTGKVHLATTSECDGKDPKKWFNKKSFLRMVSKLDKQWSGNLDRLQ